MKTAILFLLAASAFGQSYHIIRVIPASTVPGYSLYCGDATHAATCVTLGANSAGTSLGLTGAMTISSTLGVTGNLTVNTVYGLTSAGALTVASCTGCGGVTSFNTRTGAVTLSAADVTTVVASPGLAGNIAFQLDNTYTIGSSSVSPSVSYAHIFHGVQVEFNGQWSVSGATSNILNFTDSTSGVDMQLNAQFKSTTGVILYAPSMYVSPTTNGASASPVMKIIGSTSSQVADLLNVNAWLSGDTNVFKIDASGNNTTIGNFDLNAEDKYLAVDASSASRLGFTKKNGFDPFASFGSGIDFAIKQSNGTSIAAAGTFTTRFKIDGSTGAVTISQLAGAGNLPACLDTNGKVFAGTNTTGVLTCP